jgi:hypothetical protein
VRILELVKRSRAALVSRGILSGGLQGQGSDVSAQDALVSVLEEERRRVARRRLRVELEVELLER